MAERDAPRTFREVGMMIFDIKDDIEKITRVQEKIIARMDRNIQVLVVSILSPIIVGSVLAFIFRQKL